MLGWWIGVLLCCNGYSQQVKPDSLSGTQQESQEQFHQSYKFSQFVQESVKFVKIPLYWKGSDWLKVGVISLSTFACMPFDRAVTNTTRPNPHLYNSVPVIAGKIYGEWYTIGGIAASIGLYGLVAHNHESKNMALELFQAGLYSEGVTAILKTAIGRERPTHTNESFTFKPFTFLDDNYQSMPSGHTTAAIALSTVLSRHAKTTFLKILAYVPAAFTIYSRIYQDQHWLSDVIPAMAIGYFAANWVVNLHERNKHRVNLTSIYPPTFSIGLY